MDWAVTAQILSLDWGHYIRCNEARRYFGWGPMYLVYPRSFLDAVLDALYG